MFKIIKTSEVTLHVQNGQLCLIVLRGIRPFTNISHEKGGHSHDPGQDKRQHKGSDKKALILQVIPNLKPQDDKKLFHINHLPF